MVCLCDALSHHGGGQQKKDKTYRDDSRHTECEEIWIAPSEALAMRYGLPVGGTVERRTKVVFGDALRISVQRKARTTRRLAKPRSTRTQKDTQTGRSRHKRLDGG